VSTLMRRLGWALCLAALCRTDSQARARICLDVNLRFNEQAPPAALVESMQQEAAAIWKTYGIDLRWEDSSAPPPGGAVLFDVLLDQSHHSELRAVLGDARLPAQPSRYVPIRLDRQAIEDVLRMVTFEQLSHLTRHANIREEDVGRALGRVLAHELGHALLATGEHRAIGLMRPAFSGEELLAGRRDLYDLSAADVARLASIRRGQLEPASR